MMKITYEQESKEWITELVESWNINDTKDEKELTDFLKKNIIPYNVGYTFNKESGVPEGISINLNIVHEEPNFNKMLGFVNELLSIQEKVVKIKTIKPKQKILEKVVEQKPLFDTPVQQTKTTQLLNDLDVSIKNDERKNQEELAKELAKKRTSLFRR